MDTEQENTDLTGADVYDAATAPPEPVEATEDRARDEKGRFAPKEEASVEAVAEAPAPVEAPKEEKPDHRIPLTELLNEREKRQTESRRAEQLQRELEALRQQMQPPKQQEPVPDQFANPEAYNEYWRQENAKIQEAMDRRFRDQEANFSLRLAHMQHGELFEKAYAALQERSDNGDKIPAQMVVGSPDPGKTLVDWYQREQAIAHVGPDPVAYRSKLEEELLGNPEFLAKAIEKARGVASTQPTQVKLPPSLNKATSAQKDSGAMTDMGLYHHAIGRE